MPRYVRATKSFAALLALERAFLQICSIVISDDRTLSEDMLETQLTGPDMPCKMINTREGPSTCRALKEALAGRLLLLLLWLLLLG